MKKKDEMWKERRFSKNLSTKNFIIFLCGYRDDPLLNINKLISGKVCFKESGFKERK